MKRTEAIDTITKALKGNEAIVLANGLISREMCAIKDTMSNFYMLGSMGLASSIGLGLAISLPHKKVVVVDGDANLLMNMGSLATIGNLAPKNLGHVVLDNESHESTGGQPSVSGSARLEKVAEACGFRVVKKVHDASGLEIAMNELLNVDGPSFILVKIEKGGDVPPRVHHTPEAIKTRFKNGIK